MTCDTNSYPFVSLRRNLRLPELPDPQAPRGDHRASGARTGEARVPRLRLRRWVSQAEFEEWRGGGELWGGGIREAVGRRSKGRREKWEAVGKGRGVWGEGRRRGGRVILGDEVFCGKL